MKTLKKHTWGIKSFLPHDCSAATGLAFLIFNTCQMQYDEESQIPRNFA